MGTIHRASGRRPLTEFGEQVLGKLARQRMARHAPLARPNLKRKLAARWIQGTWVGQDPRTGEHILVTSAGRAVRVRSIKRKPLNERLSKATIFSVEATPRYPNPPKRQENMEAPTDETLEPVITTQKESHIPVEPDRPRAMQPRDDDIRELRLTKRIFQKFGFSTDNGVPCMDASTSRRTYIRAVTRMHAGK